jgi:hypothetical protein
MANQSEENSRRSDDLSAQAHSDDPRQAIESGEPRIAGHQGTHIIDDAEDEGTAKPSPDKPRRKPGEKQNWESDL